MRIAAALIAAASLIACSPAAPGGGEAPVAAAPNPADIANAAFRLEANHTRNGRTTPVVMVRDGGKLRLEMTNERGPMTVIVDRDKGEGFTVFSMGGRPMAMRIDLSARPQELDFMDQEFSADVGTQVGTCSVAGQTGTEWERTDDGKVKRGCVTADGVILRTSTDGVVDWEAVSVTRGPQPADQFTLPEGVQVMDTSAMSNAAADALAKMKAAAGR